MTKKQKILFIIVGILTVCSLLVNVSLYSAFYVFPDKLNVKYVTLKNKKIPETLNSVSIVYFTDLQYGEYEDDERLEQVMKSIKKLDPDILIFGGDFFDEGYEIKDDTIWKMVDYLNDIEAPLGKYAVWGEKDLNDESHKAALDSIYSQSQFEVLSDTGAKITNGSKDGIHIFGLSDQPNYDIINSSTSSDEYNLLVTHKPDYLVDTTLSSIDYALAGHSHGTQITFPLYGGYKDVDGATKLNRSVSENVGFKYIISTGVGCTNINARFMATPEIYYFVLRH